MKRRSERTRLPWRGAPVAVTVAAAGTIAVVAIAYAGGVNPTVASGIDFGPTASVAPGMDTRPLVTATAAPNSHGSGLVSLATTGIPGFTSIPSAQMGSPAPAQATGPSGGSGQQTAPPTSGDSRSNPQASPAGAVSTPSVSFPPDARTTLSVPQTGRPATDPSLTTSAGSSTLSAPTLSIGSSGGSSSTGSSDAQVGGTAAGAPSGTTPGRGSDSSGATGATTGGGAGSGVFTGRSAVGGTGATTAGSGRAGRWSGTGDPAASNRGSHPDRPTSEAHGSVSPSFVPPDYPVVVADATGARHGQSGSRRPKSR